MKPINPPFWCVPLDHHRNATRGYDYGYANLDEHGILSVGTGLGPRDPRSHVVASVTAPPIQGQGTHFLHLDDTGRLGVYRHEHLGSHPRKLWKLPFIDGSELTERAQPEIQAQGCSELLLVMLPLPTLCVYTC